MEKKTNNNENTIIIIALILLVGFLLYKGGYLDNFLGNGDDNGDDNPCNQCCPGETQCSGMNDMMFQTCGEDGIWDNHGFIDGKCGYPPSMCAESGYSCIEDDECCSNKCAYFQCV